MVIVYQYALDAVASRSASSASPARASWAHLSVAQWASCSRYVPIRPLARFAHPDAATATPLASYNQASLHFRRRIPTLHPLLEFLFCLTDRGRIFLAAHSTRVPLQKILDVHESIAVFVAIECRPHYVEHGDDVAAFRARSHEIISATSATQMPLLAMGMLVQS